jgi:nucleoside-diphosphate-sugar epimerase
MRVLLVGCGYVASALARRLRASGHELAAVVRTAGSAGRLAELGLEARAADCRDARDARRACAGTFDAVVFSLSANGGDYREVYVDALRNVLEGLAGAPRFLYAGSSSVYGESGGGWVDEATPPAPATPNARVLLEAEELLAARASGRFAAFAVRLSGIYGPGRAHLLDLLRSGAAVLPGRADAWVNRIHRDDAASALAHLLALPPGAAGCATFNATDDEPSRQGDVARWICERLGRPPPRFDDAAPPARHGAGAGANRRISNARLRATGWRPSLPSYREGFLPFLQTA